MATFSVDFLGCKVSHSDAQEIRERLVRDGHMEAGASADVAVLNAAAGLVVAGRAKDLKQAAALAEKSISSGEAEGRLQRLITISNA